MSDFAYLHLHTHFSRGGGPTAPIHWCRRAVELGYKTLAFTDRAPLAALPSVYIAARETGIRPLFGVEVDVLLPVAGRKGESVPQPAILLACGADGLKSLAKLASDAFAGWPGTERALAWDILAAHSGGLLLILLGGDEAGTPTSCVTLHKKLASWANSAKRAFSDSIFVGLPHSGRPGDGVLAEQAAAAAAALDLPAVATPTARYLHPEDAPAYEALKIARSYAGWPREADMSASTASVAPDGPGHDYLRSPEEAAALYTQWPQAIENVSRIAEMCAIGTEKWPLQSAPSHTESSYLQELAHKKLMAQLSADTIPPELAEALRSEASATLGQEGAWVALATLVDIASRSGPTVAPVPLGAPTGRANCSPLSSALGLCGSEQLKTPHLWGLPGVEIPANRGDYLVASLSSEFGPDRLAFAACPLPIMPAQAAQAAARVLGLSGETLKDSAIASIERGWEAFAVDGEHDGHDASRIRLAALAAALKGAPLTFVPDLDTLLAMPRQTHGSSTLASYATLLSSDNVAWLPWTEEDVSTLDYPVFKLHSTQSLKALDLAISLARRYPVPGLQAERLDLSTLPPLNDAANQILRKGELVGIPYFAATATKAWSGELTDETAAQLVARSLHPKHPAAPEPKPSTWDDITAATGGALLFEEQLVALLLSLGVAEDDLAAVQKALLDPAGEESKEAKALIIKAAELKEEQAQALISNLSEHSRVLVARDAALAWGRIALWLVALKAAHPAAFIAGSLACADERATVTKLAAEAQRLGVKIAQPDVNRSEAEPLLQREGEAWGVLWGLSQIPAWRASEASRFVASRPHSGFNSLREVTLAAASAELSASHVEALIRSGACDALGTLGMPVRDHEAMLAVLPAMYEWAEAARASAGQLDLFASSKIEPPVEEDLIAASSASGTEETRKRGTLHSPRLLYLRKQWEQTNLGIAFTSATEMTALVSALEKSGDLRTRLLTTAQIGAQHLGTSISLVAILCSIRTIEGESDPLAVACLEDVEGSIEIVAFPPNYKRYSEFWVENNLLSVTARVSQHEDGEIYLLSEHIAPFQVGSTEEAITLTIKIPKAGKSSSKADAANPDRAQRGAEPAPARMPDYALSAQAAPQSGQNSAPRIPEADTPAAYSLIISIPPSRDDHVVIDNMIALNNLLNANPGRDSVTLRVQYSPETGNWTSARLPGGVRFSHSLEQSIRRLLGVDALAVIRLVS